jgi:GLPGLI family protein
MNIKKIIIILITAIAPLTAQNIEAEVQYEKVFNFAKAFLPLNFIPQQEKENMMYKYGKSAEKWGKEDMVLYIKNNQTRFTYSKVNTQGYTYSWTREAYDLIHDFTNSTLDWQVSFMSKPKYVEDSLQQYNWKIENEVKEVAGYMCMKASTEDKAMMHKIVAWFAMDLPISSGPDRFTGLPGLILELDMNEGAQIFTAKSVKMREIKPDEIVLENKKKQKKINFSNYRKLILDHMSEKIKREEYPYDGLQY